MKVYETNCLPSSQTMQPYHISPQGIHLSVKVAPKSSRNKIEKIENGRLKIKITTAAEKGKANEAVIKLLSDAFDIAKSQIILIQGETNPLKIFLFQGISLLDFEKKLKELIN